MALSDELLGLITQLQQDTTVTRGRRQLLEYMRMRTGARLALLFLLDKAQRQLVLLEKRGRQGRSVLSRDHSNLPDTRHIPIHGLFGSALRQRGELSIVDASTCPQCLAEERYWVGGSRRILLSAIGFERQRGSAQQGILVLCFDGESDGEAFRDNIGLLICVALLSAYLPETRTRSRTVAKPTKPVGKSRLPAVPVGAASIHKAAKSHPHRQSQAAPELALPQPAEQQLQEAIEQERGRIAHDIHDGAAQQIGLVLHKLEYIQRVFATQPALALRELRLAYEILEESLRDLRYGISSLLATRWEEEGFEVALQALLEDVALNDPGLQITTDMQHLGLLPSTLEAPIFRLIQEALNNVRKHARADSALVRVQARRGLLLVEVRDNGVGFPMEQIAGSASGHLGLRGMRERVQQAGGKWEIHSAPGAGTTVTARFPLAMPNSRLTRREREVLRLLIQGLTNRAIAARLSVSAETVKSHVHHIMQKLHVTDRTQAAVLASKGQWL